MSIEPTTLLRAQPGQLVQFAGTNPATGLPTPLTPLVGREREIAAVSALLRDRAVRLVTLTGPGGVGKTRLALRVAAEVAPDFADGVDFVELAAIHEPSLVVPAIARALHVRHAHDQVVLQALVAVLRRRTQLLVLDNFEQLTEAAPVVTELLRACPGLTALVTSRAVLNVTGEWVAPVPPLTLPDGTSEIGEASLADLGEVDAVRLFVERSRAAKRDFALTVENAPAVIEICTRLDGLPLAIELAAARGGLFPPVSLLARLERRLPLLTGGPRDLPSRQRTMRHAIDWSYDLPSPEEQAVFRRLSVFVGGCTLDAAEAVCGGAELTTVSSIAFATIVESLTRHCLLKAVTSPSLGDGEVTPRLTMLETVREFAAEELTSTGDGDAKRRHAAYFQALASRTEQTYWGDAPGDARQVLLPEIGNLRAALSWATEHGEADAALQLARGMFDPYWMFDPIWRTGDSARDLRAWTRRALAMPGSSPRHRVTALIGAASLAEAHDDDDARAAGRGDVHRRRSRRRSRSRDGLASPRANRLSCRRSCRRPALVDRSPGRISRAERPRTRRLGAMLPGVDRQPRRDRRGRRPGGSGTGDRSRRSSAGGVPGSRLPARGDPRAPRARPGRLQAARPGAGARAHPGVARARLGGSAERQQLPRRHRRHRRPGRPPRRRSAALRGRRQGTHPPRRIGHAGLSGGIRS